MEHPKIDRYVEDIFGVGSNIDIFVTESIEVNILENEWKYLRDCIALEYQRKLTDDFERWNFYIFYVVEDFAKLPKNLKFKIEHDTLSSRKIVISHRELFGKDIPKYLISKYLSYPISIREKSNIDAFIKDETIVELLNQKENED